MNHFTPGQRSEIAKLIKKAKAKLIDRIEKECVYDSTDGVHIVVITRFDKENFEAIKKDKTL